MEEEILKYIRENDNVNHVDIVHNFNDRVNEAIDALSNLKESGKVYAKSVGWGTRLIAV
jgi:hypothetical protein